MTTRRRFRARPGSFRMKTSRVMIYTCKGAPRTPRLEHDMIFDNHSMTHWRSCPVVRAFVSGIRRGKLTGGLFEAALDPNGFQNK